MNLDFESSFKRILLKLEESGGAYAEAKAQSWYAQEMCGSIKASIMQSLMKDDPKLSLAKAEIMAKASEDYKQHLKETSDKIRQENLTRSEYKKWDASFEANRSLSSLEKRTQQLIGD